MAYRNKRSQGNKKQDTRTEPENDQQSSKEIKTSLKVDKTKSELKEKVFDKKDTVITDDPQQDKKDTLQNNNLKLDEQVANSKKEDSKQLVEVLKTKKEHEKEVQYEILQKTIPSFQPNETVLKKLIDIKPDPAKKSEKLFRLFEPKQLPIYRASGERELRNRWYWKLKKDDLPEGDYDVREYFLHLYSQVLEYMPDYMLLKDMAVENKNSRDAGKVVDSETAKICDDIFQDEETEGVVRRFIADMRQRVNAERNTVDYPAILHPIDYEFNQYFLTHQIIEPLTNEVIYNYIPERLRNDPNYILNMDVNLPPTARYIRPVLLQDRLNLHDNFESIWDALTRANYVLARSVVPDLKELVSTEAQIQKMSQDLQLEALTIQSETQFLTGINSQAANDAFKTIIACMLSQRTISLKFVTSNYMSLISSMWLMSIVPTTMFIRESLVACQLAVINTIIYPAFGLQKMHYINGDQRTPFMIAEQQINNFQVQNWLHFVNHNAFNQVVIDGVINQTLNDQIRRGLIINQLMEALNVLARQNFQAYPIDYRRSVQRGILLLANRVGQLVDLTRLMCYNYETLMSCITMNMQNVQTLTTEELQLTSVTSLCMLIGNTTVIPEPRTLFHYYQTNVNFHNNYNERINDAVAIIAAANHLDLYRKKMKSIVEDFLKKLHIFDVAKVPDDQMYRLRDRLRRLPVERRRVDVFTIILNNMQQIERASDKIAQGVIIAYREMRLDYDELYGFVNLARDVNGYQQINLEELMRSGDYSQITNILLNNQPVALVGAIPFTTDSAVTSLIAKLDATVFAQIVKQRKVDTIKPILFKINSDSNDFYLVVNYNWIPTSTTKVFKQVPQIFDFRAAMYVLSSNLTFTMFHELLPFVNADTVEPINAVAFDNVRIMQEL
uniref:Inner capsid protein VP2 n=1 Tax=Rotavirus A TaxID=28875 RepID=A0A6M8NKX9_9REOV|nr:core capsid protein [Rotavirus A]